MIPAKVMHETRRFILFLSINKEAINARYSFSNTKSGRQFQFRRGRNGVPLLETNVQYGEFKERNKNSSQKEQYPACNCLHSELDSYRNNIKNLERKIMLRANKYIQQERISKNLKDDYISSLMEKEVIHSNVRDFGVYRPLDHTMGNSIDKYVNQRIPVQLFEHAISNFFHIQIHGMYPGHFHILKEKLKLRECEEYIFMPNKKKKKFNNVRPRYYTAKDRNNQTNIYVLVTPGADYIHHYSSMIRHIISYLTSEKLEILQIHRYPNLEKKISNWTELDDNFIKPKDTLIVGYVDELENNLIKRVCLKKISHNENEYYASTRYKLGGLVLNFLGVKYSFWGNISSFIAKKACELGIREMIYMAKQGSLTSENDLYKKIYSATNFLNMNSLKIRSHITDIENPMVKMFPELDTGCHVSVPTVLEESYMQREIATKNYEPQSIDNEISQMAEAIDQFNKTSKANVSYFNLHFATDYIRSKQEKILKTEFDLSNNRSSKAYELKGQIINKVSNYLAEYFISTSTK